MKIAKSVLYRIIRLLLLVIISFLIIGDVSNAISISIIDAFVATLYYYYFDKIWDSHLERYIKEIYLMIKYRSFNKKD